MIRKVVNIVEKACDLAMPSSIQAYINWLSKNAPVYSVHGSQVKIIYEPSEFYNALHKKCQTAKRRILLTSLYLGTGKLSENLVNTLDDKLKESKNLDVRVLLDANRGSRGQLNSRQMLLPLLTTHPQVQVSLYHTPRLRGWVRKLLPQRYNELVGLQHMKIYLFDDDVIISGANLSEDYFTQRQDRYVLVSGCKGLADFYWGLIGRLADVSFRLDPSDTLKTEVVHPFESPLAEYVKIARESVWGYCLDACRIKESESSSSDGDTWIHPVIEVPPLGIEQDSTATSELLNSIPPGSSVTLSTGYFNMTRNFAESARNVAAQPDTSFRLVMAHPSANGFDGTKWPMCGIPQAYTALAEEFLLLAAEQKGKALPKLLEYSRIGWTFHVKGLWLTLPQESTPSITIVGSSNFGVRSVERDVESSLIIVTENPELREALGKEEKSSLEHCREFTVETAKDPERCPPLWVRATLAAFRTFF